jgi:membrane fusion protein (multidrug efflux system)
MRVNRKRMRTLVLLAVFGIGAASALGACSSEATDAPATATAGGAPRGGPGGPGGAPTGPRAVRTTVAELGTVEQIYLVTGEFAARDTVGVSPLSAGLLATLLVDEGARVEAGQLLGALDSAMEEQAVHRAEASRRTASARVELVEAQRAEHLAEVERRRALRNSGAMAAADFEALEARTATYDAELGLAQAQRGEADAALRAARVEVERRELRAPVSGAVVARHAMAGSWVTPQSPVVSIVDESGVELVIPVPERDIARVVVGTELRVRVDGFAEPMVADVTRISPQSDSESRTIAVAARLRGAVAPRPGTFAAAEVIFAREENAVVVPVEAMATNAERVEGVWTVVDATARFVPVTVVLKNERQAAVTGIAAGTELILEAPRGLEDGGAVAIAGVLPGAEGGAR